MSEPQDRIEIGRILGEISEYEYKHNRPLLSAIVLSKGSGVEGNGFYKLCENLGITNNWKLLRENDFSIKEIRKAHDFWREDNNYQNYH
jgi:hypothetical protein